MATRTTDEVDVPAVNLILDAYNLADVGKYAEALAAIKAAKSADARNIYVIALEKQFAKLLSLPEGPAADEARDTLPALLDRALDNARNNQKGPETGPVDSSAIEREEKETRLKELKNQYFTRADEFVERGDFASALAEIKRVKIIDPGNRVAREYEEKIAQLATPQSSTVDRGREIETPPEEPVMSGERVGMPPQRSTPPAASPKGKDSRVGLFIAIGVIIVAGGVGTFFFMRQPAAPPTSAPTAQQSQAPDQTKDQAPVTTTAAVPTAQEATPPVNGTAQVQEQPTTTAPAVPESSPAGKEERKSTTTRDENRTRTETSTKSSVSEMSIPKQEKMAEPPPQIQAAPIASATPAQKEKTETPSAPTSGAFVPVQKEPKVVKIMQPQIPSAALETKQTGKVIVKVQIDPQGKPVKAVITSSTNHVFDDAVIDAVMHSTFEPGMMSTGPVTTWMSIPFAFK